MIRTMTTLPLVKENKLSLAIVQSALKYQFDLRFVS